MLLGKKFHCKYHGEQDADISIYFSISKSKKIVSIKCHKCLLERAKKYRDSHKKEMAECKKNWLQRNKESVAKRINKWRKENPEKNKSIKDRWIKKNTDKINFYARQYANKKRCSGVNDFTFDQWKELLNEHKYSCYYCGCTDKKLTQDHIIPISKNGNHTKSNIVPSCQSCNSRKGNRLLSEFNWKEELCLN